MREVLFFNYITYIYIYTAVLFYYGSINHLKLVEVILLWLYNLSRSALKFNFCYNLWCMQISEILGLSVVLVFQFLQLIFFIMCIPVWQISNVTAFTIIFKKTLSLKTDYFPDYHIIVINNWVVCIFYSSQMCTLSKKKSAI